MLKKNSKLKITTISFVIISILTILYLNSKLDVTKYNFSSKKLPKVFDGFKIVQLSDFHGEGIGENNKLIVEKIKKINPDIVVMTGDMINESIDNIEDIKGVISELKGKYPIYYVDGNHEQIAAILSTKIYDSYLAELKDLGVVVLKNESVEIVKDNNAINIAGIDMPLDDGTALFKTESELDENYIDNTIRTGDDDKFKILLAHNPLFIKEYSKWGADLVLSGHMHGGIVRIPVIGIGLFSTEQKLFPKYDAGKFKVDNSTMIVNRGIGNSSVNIRIFNKPEIGLITLKCK
ncbi:MAG: metallophosphoesterase [Clostridium sp.]